MFLHIFLRNGLEQLPAMLLWLCTPLGGKGKFLNHQLAFNYEINYINIKTRPTHHHFLQQTVQITALHNTMFLVFTRVGNIICMATYLDLSWCCFESATIYLSTLFRKALALLETLKVWAPQKKISSSFQSKF